MSRKLSVCKANVHRTPHYLREPWLSYQVEDVNPGVGDSIIGHAGDP
jgi:hypothetical protein